jgi:hypothetical protein
MENLSESSRIALIAGGAGLAVGIIIALIILLCLWYTRRRIVTNRRHTRRSIEERQDRYNARVLAELGNVKVVKNPRLSITGTPKKTSHLKKHKHKSRKKSFASTKSGV